MFRKSILVTILLSVSSFLNILCIDDDKSKNTFQVETSLGVVKGSFLKTRYGQSISSFRGIRYAKPPTNELRFQVNFINI